MLPRIVKPVDADYGYLRHLVPRRIRQRLLGDETKAFGRYLSASIVCSAISLPEYEAIATITKNLRTA